MILIGQNYLNYIAPAWPQIVRLALPCLWLCLWPAVGADAQIVETAGSRALGMGGAFVAVASDSSATWWNPAGLAAGPFVDLALAGNLVQVAERLPAWRHRTSWFAFGTPPVGLAYYRFRITDIQPFDPTGQAGAGRQDSREDRRAGVPVRSLSVGQLGVTLVRTLVSGVHTGTTLKYVRGTVRGGREDSLARPSDLLAKGEAFDGGRAESRFDLDVGVIGIAGPLRLGAVVRNVRNLEFGTVGSDTGASSTRFRLPRQIRVGAAFDPELTTGVPLTIAFDADVRAYATASGARRMVALGAEHWFLAKRVGVRAGAGLGRQGKPSPRPVAGR